MRNRTIGINVRVSENEKKKLQKNAQKANLKLSSYLRKVGLQQKFMKYQMKNFVKFMQELLN